MLSKHGQSHVSASRRAHVCTQSTHRARCTRHRRCTRVDRCASLHTVYKKEEKKGIKWRKIKCERDTETGEWRKSEMRGIFAIPLTKLHPFVRWWRASSPRSRSLCACVHPEMRDRFEWNFTQSRTSLSSCLFFSRLFIYPFFIVTLEDCRWDFILILLENPISFWYDQKSIDELLSVCSYKISILFKTKILSGN